MKQANSVLETLYLNGNKIGDEGCGNLALALKGGSKLRELYLNGNNIKDEGAEIEEPTKSQAMR